MGNKTHFITMHGNSTFQDTVNECHLKIGRCSVTSVKSGINYHAFPTNGVF